MESRLLQSREKSLINLLLTFCVGLTLGACSVPQLRVDPCAVDPHDPSSCRAVPLNQPGRPDYNRSIQPGDVCFSAEDYAALQKNYREVLRRCGDSCK